jgi:hypothetical protein
MASVLGFAWRGLDSSAPLAGHREWPGGRGQPAPAIGRETSDLRAAGPTGLQEEIKGCRQGVLRHLVFPQALARTLTCRVKNSDPGQRSSNRIPNPLRVPTVVQ